MTYPRTVSARLLDYDGSVIGGSPLANAFGILFYDEWNGPGTGQVSLSLSEAGSAQILPGRYVDCLVEGTSRFTFKIEGNPEYRVVERGEEYDQVLTVRGRGWGCVFDEAITLPEYSLKFSLETTWRLFTFASALFPNAGAWGNANETHEYLEGVSTAHCYGHWQMAPDGLPYPAPIGWPWGTNPFNLVNGTKTGNYVNQYWLTTSNQPEYSSTGYLFFRAEFTLADFTAVTFDVTGDNFFTFFLEGVPILGEQIDTADHWMWQGWKSHQLWLPAGTYTVACAIYNIKFSDMGATPPYPNTPPCPEEGWAGGPRDDNPAGLLAAIYVAGDPVTPPTYILTSDATWVSFWDPDTWPGWTPGQIVQQLIDEAVARGALTVLDPSHAGDADDDSDGLDWRPVVTDYNRPDLPTFGVEVGTTLMAALQSLQNKGWINWHARPGTLILDLFRGRAPSAPSSSATLSAGPGGNLMAYEKNATSPYANALLVQWEGGYVVVEDAAAIAAYGTRVEALWASDAGSENEAILAGETELLSMAQSGYPAIVAVVEPTGAGDCPYEAFETGDYVTTPDGLVRCYSVRCQQDAEGYAIWSTELNAKLDVPERRQLELLMQIGGRNQVVRGAVN